MLQAIALDLCEPESEKQKADKSKGEAADKNDETAAKVHGADRLALGFTLNSAVAEYRALRASVAVIKRHERMHGEIELKNRGGSSVVFDCIFVPVLVDKTLESVAGPVEQVW